MKVGFWENKNVLLWNKKKAGSIGRGPFGSHLGSLYLGPVWGPFGACLGPILPSLGPIRVPFGAHMDPGLQKSKKLIFYCLPRPGHGRVDGREN